MPIQIIDNFDLNAEKAIDNRMVVGPTPSFYHNKDDIPNKYPGLRVWELPGAETGPGATNGTPNGLAYAWTGTQWISENTTSISGGGQVLRMAYFNSPNSIQSTEMTYDITDGNVGIGYPAETGTSALSNQIARLKLNGNIKISGKFIGDAGGAYGGVNTMGIININASNIIYGTMNINRLGGSPNVDYILTSDTINSASYKIPSSINVGSATQLQNARLIYGNTFNGTSNVTGNLIFGTNSGKATLVYNQTQARNFTIPSVSGDRTFSFIDQVETISANKTFTNPVSMTYNGTNTGDPPSLTTQKLTVNDSLSVVSSASFLGSVTVTQTNPGGSGTFQKLKITEGANQWWVTFGLESGANNPARIRSGNSSAANPSYTWRGDENTGLYWPSDGVIGFTINGVEKMRIDNNGVLISTNVSNPLIIDGGSSGNSYLTFKSNSTDSSKLGHISSTSFTISNEVGKSIIFRSSQNNSVGGNVELKLSLNNGASTAPPELSAAQPAGLFIYNGGWRNIHANAFTPGSDIRIKKDIVEYTDSVLNDVMKIKPITYDLVYDDDDKRYMGFSAQNLFEINPLLVSGDTSDIYGELKDHRNILGLNTTGIIAMLTNAIKELNLKIKELESKK